MKDNSISIASRYERYADIQDRLCEELLEKIKTQETKPRRCLDVGCGTAKLSAALQKYSLESKLIGLDINFEMIKAVKDKASRVLAADAKDIPFQEGVFDLVVSNAVYQWVRDLKKAFGEVKRILTEKGIFIFNCFGAGTLEELRNCFKIKDNFLPTKELIHRNLKETGFSNIELEDNLRYKYFDNLTGILYWLKNIGANHTYSNPPFLTPQKLNRLNGIYRRNYRYNGKVYASFEVIWVKAEKL